MFGVSIQDVCSFSDVGSTSLKVGDGVDGGINHDSVFISFQLSW